MFASCLTAEIVKWASNNTLVIIPTPISQILLSSNLCRIVFGFLDIQGHFYGMVSIDTLDLIKSPMQ